MTALVPHELVEFLAKSQLLTPSNLENLERESATFASAEELTDTLVRRGWITSYQQTHLLGGQGDKLIFGPYRILEPLGEGGMGLVLKAWHPRLDRMVALKIIRPQVLAARPDMLTRFHREARAVAQLNHPNVVILFDADEFSGTHFLAMEYVDGHTLEKMVRQNGPLAYKQACDYMRQAALGLQHAHDVGLVHRDIKPSNILVSVKPGTAKRSSVLLKRPSLVTLRDRELNTHQGNGRSEAAWGIVKILDMGLARLQESLDDEGNPQVVTPLTRAGALLGTPDFISPEQARDARSVDIRSDLYSLGCTFYYILTGRPPFPGGTDVQKLLKHQNEQPYPIEELRPHIPATVGGIIRKLMEKKPSNRHQTPQDLADELAHLLSYLSATSTPPRGTSLSGVTPAAVTAIPPEDTPLPIAEFSQDVHGEGELAEAIPDAEDLLTKLTDLPVAEVIQPSIGISSAHTGIVGSLALSDDGARLISGGLDGRVRMWNLEGVSPRELAFLPRPGAEVQSVLFAPDEPYAVVTGTQHGSVRVWRWDWSESRVYDWGAFTDEKGGGAGGVFSHDGQMFALGVGSSIAVWKVNKRNASGRTILKGHSQSVRSLAFSPDRRLLASGSEGKTLRLWGFGWLGTSLKAKLACHDDIVSAVAFSSDGKRLASGGLDRSIYLWDPLTPSADTAVQLTGHTDSIKLVRFLPGNRELLSIGENGQVIVWDVVSGSKNREYQLHTSMGCSIATTPDGKRIAIGTTDGQVLVFDMMVPKATRVG